MSEEELKWGEAYEKLLDKHNELQSEAAALRAALEQYSADCNWAVARHVSPHLDWWTGSDGPGYELARKALNSTTAGKDLLERLEEAEAVVTFYGEQDNYQYRESWVIGERIDSGEPILNDGGQKAREYLQKWGNQ